MPDGWTPPENVWSEYTIEDGTSYFFNKVTGTSQWERPANVVPFSRKSRMERLQVIKRSSRVPNEPAVGLMDGLSGVELTEKYVD